MASSNAEYLRAWKKANPEKVAEYARRDAAKHPERMRKNALRWRHKHLDLARERDAIAQRKRRAEKPEAIMEIRERMRLRRLAAQETRAGCKRPSNCEVYGCGKAPPVFDHCHASELFRGWICDRCNKTLGHVKDDPALLRALADYLEKFDGETKRKAA